MLVVASSRNWFRHGEQDASIGLAPQLSAQRIVARPRRDLGPPIEDQPVVLTSYADIAGNEIVKLVKADAIGRLVRSRDRGRKIDGQCMRASPINITLDLPLSIGEQFDLVAAGASGEVKTVRGIRARLLAKIQFARDGGAERNPTLGERDDADKDIAAIGGAEGRRGFIGARLRHFDAVNGNRALFGSCRPLAIEEQEKTIGAVAALISEPGAEV